MNHLRISQNVISLKIKGWENKVKQYFKLLLINENSLLLSNINFSFLCVYLALHCSSIIPYEYHSKLGYYFTFRNFFIIN